MLALVWGAMKLERRLFGTETAAAAQAARTAAAELADPGEPAKAQVAH